MTNGRYLFQSKESISVPDAGTVSAAAVTGLVKAFAFGPETKDGARRSKILTVPSVEQVAMMSGWCGEKRA